MTEKSSAQRKKLIFWSIIIIFFYGVGLRLAYIESAEIFFPIRADVKKYVTIAENLIQHGAYSTAKTPPFVPDTFITPGYPLFLATIMKVTPDFVFAYVTIQRLQAFLSALTAVIIFLIGLEFLPLWGAFLVGCLMVISPHAVVMSGYLLTETLFAFLLYLAIYSAIKGLKSNHLKWFGLLGILAGAASLVRPALFLFPFLAAVIIWSYLPKEKKLKACSIMLLTFLLLQAPWLAWKKANTVTGSISPSAASLALGIYPDLIYKNPELRGKPYREDPEFDKMSRSAKTTVEVMLQRAQKEPWKYLKWYLFNKPLLFWSWETVVGTGGPFLLMVMSCIYYDYTIAAYSFLFFKWIHPVFLISACFSILFVFTGLLKQKQQYCSGPGIQIIALLALYFTAVHTVLAPLPRYSMPLHGALYLLGTCGVVSMAGFIKGKYMIQSQSSGK